MQNAVGGGNLDVCFCASEFQNVPFAPSCDAIQAGYVRDAKGGYVNIFTVKAKIPQRRSAFSPCYS